MSELDTRLRVGTFNPKRTDDLRPEAKAFIGKTTTWSYGWLMDEDDTTKFVGQVAWCPRGDGWTAFGWAPECDIDWEDTPVNADMEDTGTTPWTSPNEALLHKADDVIGDIGNGTLNEKQAANFTSTLNEAIEEDRKAIAKWHWWDRWAWRFARRHGWYGLARWIKPTDKLLWCEMGDNTD